MKKALFTILLLAGFLTLSKSSNAQNPYYSNPKASYVANGSPTGLTYTFLGYDASTGLYSFNVSYGNFTHYAGTLNLADLQQMGFKQQSTGAPLDGGLSFLLIGGAAYHIKRKKNNKQAGADVA